MERADPAVLIHDSSQTGILAQELCQIWSWEGRAGLHHTGHPLHISALRTPGCCHEVGCGSCAKQTALPREQSTQEQLNSFIMLFHEGLQASPAGI